MTVPDALTPPSETAVTASYGAADAAHLSKNGSSGLAWPPILLFVLVVVTFGFWSIVWSYLANRELKNFHPSIEVVPWLAAVSLLVPIAGLVSIYRTGQRIQQAQVLAGMEARCTPLLGAVLGWLMAAHPVYYQHALNGIWKHRQL